MSEVPLTPGHEIADIVGSLGENARGFSKDERVLSFPGLAKDYIQHAGQEKKIFAISLNLRYIHGRRLCTICSCPRSKIFN